MNPIVVFYHALLALLSRDDDDKEKLRELVIFSLKKCSGQLSVQFTEEQLDKLCEGHRLLGEGLYPDEGYHNDSENFLMAAFKDLSLLKNPLAKRLFRRLVKEFGCDQDLFLWVSKSAQMEADDVTMAVVTLSVSDWELLKAQFEILREHKKISGDLEAGMRIDYA